MAERRKIIAKKSSQQPTIERTPSLSAADQEKVLQQLHTRDAQVSRKKVQRVTVDFPVDIYEQMKTATEESGHTLKWYIVNLVKKNLEIK